MSDPEISELLSLFNNREATVGIVGLGYVGLPLAATACEQGFRVMGFDVDKKKMDAFAQRKSYLKHIPDETLGRMVDTNRFEGTMDYGRLGEADAVLICVPTPLTKQREPDLSYVVKTVEAILPNLRKGQIIALESTTYPGTTREVMKPILERSGLIAGKDFFLAYSPEREDPGNQHFNTANIPKVVGGDGADACRLAEALYGNLVDNIVMVSSVEAAEATKLTENIFRAVNIALVNELKIVYEAMGIDVWEVIEAAKSKPFGYMPFYPGPGLGGHCIPIDPFYLTWKAREYDISTKFIELAGEINTAMPRRVVEKLSFALNERFRKSLNGSRILLVGVAYKKNIDDQRESPAFKILNHLEEHGAETAFYDLFLPQILPTREHPQYTGRRSIEYTPTVLKGFDAAIIVTDHDGVDYAALAEHVPLVVDTRNACARAGVTAANVTKA